MSAQLATTYRGGRVEGIHYGSVVITDPTGAILYSNGDPHFATYMRSSVKMFQAIPVILSGAADRFGFDDAELSICCASHAGAPYHIATVSSMMSKTGLNEQSLGCGAHEPSNKVERDRVIRLDEPFTQLHNNCSGKHTGMLSACLANGWDTTGYLDSEHPLQKQIFDMIADYTNVPISQIGTAVDGCSLPTFYLPLSNAARALARFTQEAIEGTTDHPSSRIFNAITARPEMIQEEGGMDTELIRALKGQGIVKRGAMGMFLAGVNTAQHGPVGIAIKLDDGDAASMPVVAVNALEQIGALDDEALTSLANFRRIPLINWKNIHVGEIVSGS